MYGEIRIEDRIHLLHETIAVQLCFMKPELYICENSPSAKGSRVSPKIGIPASPCQSLPVPKDRDPCQSLPVHKNVRRTVPCLTIQELRECSKPEISTYGDKMKYMTAGSNNLFRSF